MLDKLMEKASPIGMIASAAGGIMNVIGAIGQKNEAKKQMYAIEAQGRKQRSAFDTGYADLLSKAGGLKTYQGDISRYTKAEQYAQESKRAAGAGQVAGEGIMREQARQTTANTLASLQRGATSSSDLLTAALMGQNQEGAQMQNIDVMAQQQRQQMQQQAQQNYMATLGQTAAASAQQAGMQFESENAKQMQLLGLEQDRFKGGMALDQSIFNQNQQAAANFQKAKSAIWGGMGNTLGAVGSSLTNYASMTKGYENYLKARGNSGAQDYLNIV